MATNSMFWTWFWPVWTGGWLSGNQQQVKAPTKQEKFPWLTSEQIKRLESITSNPQEQQKLYQQAIQQLNNDNYNNSRIGAENEAFQKSLNQKDPRQKNYTQSNVRLEQLADMTKDTFWLDATAPTQDVINGLMSYAQDMGVSLDSLNDYLDHWDETFLYQMWLKTNQWGTKDVINQLSENNKSWDEMSKLEKAEKVTNYTNVIWLWTEKIDEAAGKFADKWLDWGNQAVEWAASSLKDKIENMSDEEIAKYRKEYSKLAKNKDIRTAYVEWDTVLERLWNWIKGNIEYRDDDEAFMKWLVSKKANLGESLAWADDVLQWESNPNVVQFFGNIPSSAVKTFTATVRWMTNPYDTLKWIYKIAATEEWHQAILDRYGSWDAFAKAINTDPVWVADDILAVAELWTNIVRGGLSATWKLTWNQSLINTANKVPVIWSANDALAQKTVGWIYNLWDNIASKTDSSLVKWANRILQDQSSLSKIVQDWKEVYDWAKETTPAKRAKNFIDEVINKTVWIDKADREFIMNNKEIVNDYVDGRKSVETVLKDVKDKISGRQLANSKMWKEYEAIRENGQTVSTEALASDMVEKLNKNKITINADWDLEFDKLSKYNTAQQKALQDAWQVIKDAQAAWNVDAWTILDLRQKFDDKVNWTWKPTELRNMSSVDKATESLIKEMRSTIDARAKAWIDGLKALDEKYAPALEEMREIKRDWFDSNGNLKDNARSKLRNLTKAGNEEKLSRLEKIAPGITNDLKALDVAQTIDRVTKQTVWQYAKWNLFAQGIGSAWILFWNAPVAIAWLWFWILATPKNFLKLVEAYPDIVEKLSAGTELLPSDMERLQALASRIQDGEIF